jgi:eukaryotic-like serine/threonine-protein kinase
LPLEQTLRYGVEIADALDKAHRQGIVHRDLKPGNVMITKSGVKLLDFGLAKVIPPAATSPLTSLPTQASPVTQAGTVLGTFQYMGPEQLEGKEADSRTDIFAFGAVLYEMATGKKAFSGASQATLISAIMTSEPQPISMAQPMSPPALDRIVKTCLAKDPEDRWQSAHDVVTELRWVKNGSAVETQEGAKRRKRERLLWIFSIATLLLLVVAQAVIFGRKPAERAVIRMSVVPPEGAAVDSISVSPDGRRLGFAGMAADGRILLWVRSLDSYASQAIPGTDGAMYPFWSPDGRFIGFFADGKVKKVAASGGAVEALADAPQPRGGSWGREGDIVFSPNYGAGLYRVSATGGAAVPVTTPDSSRGEYSHRWPSFLPDGHRFLYYGRSGQRGSGGVCVGSLDSKEARRLLAAPSNAAYARPGYLLFDREGTLMAQPFDVHGLRVSGDPVSVAEDVAYDAGSFRTDFAVSETGVLAYRSGSSLYNQITWVDREGRTIGTVGPPGAEFNLALSRDDRRLATSRLASQRGLREIWINDLARGSSSRLTFGPATAFDPIWSPDGSRVAFTSTREGGSADIYMKPATGTGNEELLLKTSQYKDVTDWSLDGRYIAFTSVDPKTKLDLWVLPLEGERKPVALAQTESDEMEAQFSPDGRWVAYVSNESGRYEVYVQTFPRPGGKWQVSNRGGVLPRWRRDGKELFYVSMDRKMMAVDIKTDTGFESDVPRELFVIRGLDAFNYTSPYTVTGDGQRFLLTVRAPQARSSPISVVLSWTAGLPR